MTYVDHPKDSKIENELNRLKTNKGYKRVNISPLRYAGGKSKAIGLILEKFPELKNRRIVSPFFGGGSFELYMSQVLGYEVIGYDIFGLLVNFWKVLINHPDKLVQDLTTLKVDKDEFTYIRHVLLNYWNKIKPESITYEPKTAITLKEEDKTILDNDIIKQASYYYYNTTLSYGPMFLGWPSSNELNPDKFKRRITRLKTLKLENLSVECMDFEDVLTKHKDDFLFLDPPYYIGDGSKMFRGLYPNSNFPIYHKSFNHEKLRDMLKVHNGGFFITYNDCDTIRDWYRDYTQIFPKWQYTFGQGETRVGKNRKNDGNNNIKESHEIFIICDPN
jgi:DNA adenine methylase